MNKFKIGDKVRIKKVLGAINHETNEPFKKNDITTVTGVITDYHVRVGHGLNYQDSGNVIYVENLELVEDEKNMYTEKDIYEGMVLECVYTTVHWFTLGEKYIVNENLTIKDDNVMGDRWLASEIVDILNNNITEVIFKVVEPEEEQLIDDKLTHLNSIVITVPKKDASGSYVNYNVILHRLATSECKVKLTKSDVLIDSMNSYETVNIEVLHEDLVYLTKSMEQLIKYLRHINQTKLNLKLNGQHFILDTQEEMDYSTTLINGLIGNI